MLYMLRHHDRREIIMTLPAHAEGLGLGHRLPSDAEKAVASQLREVLAAQMEHGGRLRVFRGENKAPAEITLLPAVSKLLIELLRHISRGDAVTLVPVSQKLTTQQAADVLNVSRPYLISLLDKGVIPFELVGRHRRIKAETLFAYKRARDDERDKALAELAALDARTL
jgi:excisionase family DNA binding protein